MTRDRSVEGSMSCPCPECGHGRSKVRDSRPTRAGHTRRRECTSCRHRFTTWEVIDPISASGNAHALTILLHRDLDSMRVKLDRLLAATSELAALQSRG